MLCASFRFLSFIMLLERGLFLGTGIACLDNLCILIDGREAVAEVFT